MHLFARSLCIVTSFPFSSSLLQTTHFTFPLLSFSLQAMSPIGAVLGGLIAGWSADGLGRKPSLLLTAVPSTIGWSAIGATYFIENKLAFDAVILIGRFLTGFGIGWSMFCAPVRERERERKEKKERTKKREICMCVCVCVCVCVCSVKRRL